MQELKINTDAFEMNDNQFFLFCSQNSDLRIERDSEKQIYIMAPTGGETGNRNSELNAQLVIWNKKFKLGYTFDSNTGFYLSNKAMRSPEVSFILKEKWEALPLEDRERFPHICPDFVIELLSKSDNLKTLKNKMQEWVDNGAQLAWLIDPQEQTVYIYKPNTIEQVIKGFNKTISGEEILPGFDLDLKELI